MSDEPKKYISASDIQRILKERGIFTFNSEKDFTIPILQTLLLSPQEFDKIRDAFRRKEDNEKKFSREIEWTDGAKIFSPDILSVNVEEFIKRKLPTCSLEREIRFCKNDNNPNHLIAKFTLNRHDVNKSWYEQTNQFTGIIEFTNDGGKGSIRITHTAPETKELAEEIVKIQVKMYKQKGVIPTNATPKKIVFSEFSNTNRFAFFYRLTNKLQNNKFTCLNIKNMSIKPEDDCALPDEIEWMDKMRKIIISGESLDKKFFMSDSKYHATLVLWNFDAVFSYEYKGEKGMMTVCLGFPDFNSKGYNSEFEINISALNNHRYLDVQNRKKLKSQLLSELDKQKTVVYNNFINYINSKKD